MDRKSRPSDSPVEGWQRITMTNVLAVSSEAASAAIGEVAQRRLRQSPYYFLKSLQCRFDRGVLTLSGRVPHRRLKQFAEAIVSRVEGVKRVANRVEVVDPVLGPSAAPRARSAG
jgi:osmotically-inducible protein OsmY